MPSSNEQYSRRRALFGVTLRLLASGPASAAISSSRQLAVIQPQLVHRAEEAAGALVVADGAAIIAAELQRLGRIGGDELRTTRPTRPGGR